MLTNKFADIEAQHPVLYDILGKTVIELLFTHINRTDKLNFKK